MIWGRRWSIPTCRSSLTLNALVPFREHGQNYWAPEHQGRNIWYGFSFAQLGTYRRWHTMPSPELDVWTYALRARNWWQNRHPHPHRILTNRWRTANCSCEDWKSWRRRYEEDGTVPEIEILTSDCPGRPRPADERTSLSRLLLIIVLERTGLVDSNMHTK